MNLVVIANYVAILIAQHYLIRNWLKYYLKLSNDYVDLVEECHKQRRIIEWTKRHANIDTIICIEEMEKEN